MNDDCRMGSFPPSSYGQKVAVLAVPGIPPENSQPCALGIADLYVGELRHLVKKG